MTERVYVHVGPHKTGTTYVQGLLTRNQARLRKQGVLFPRRSFGAQSRSLRDLLDRPVPRTGDVPTGEWATLATAVRDWRGSSAVLSHEVLSRADEAEVAAVREALRQYEVHIVFTARDLARVMPAMWQTGVRGRSSLTWDQYAERLRCGDSAGSRARAFWHGQDAPAVLDRWGEGLPREQLHVVTVPPPGSPPELLWQRFCTVLGVDPGAHDKEPSRSNPSLGVAETELMRRVNELLGDDDLDPHAWLRWTRWLARCLETRTHSRRFALPSHELDWVVERAHRIVAELRAGGYHVVGDLGDLVPHPAPLTADRPDASTDEDVLVVALDAVGRLVEEMTSDHSEEGAPV